MGPVFLFDMSIVILFVGASAGELDVLFVTEGLEVVVDKLSAIIGIDAQEFKRQSLFNLLHGLENPDLAFAHHGPTFYPGGMNVGDIEGVKELPRTRVAGVRDQIGFGKAWGFDIPGVGFDGDVMFEQSAGFGTSVESLFELAFFALESPVDSGGADREHLLLGLGRDSEALVGPKGAITVGEL